MQWSAASSAYVLLHRLTLPPDGFEYDAWSMDITQTADAGPVAVIGWIQAGSVQRLRVNAWRCDDGALLMDWTAPPNLDGLQNNPTIATDGAYIALSLWGDSDNAPTVELLTTTSNTSLFSFVSPGSMMAVDVAVDATSPAQDTVLVAAAGKAVPANKFGSGGNGYAWSVSVSK
jgi:hypothetical protein